MNKYLFLITILLGLNACQSDSSSNKSKSLNYKELSVTYCECSQTSIELSNKALKLLNNKDDKAFDGLLSEIQTTFDKTITCATDARNQYEKTTIDVEKLEENLKRNCEEMPSKLRKALLEKVK